MQDQGGSAEISRIFGAPPPPRGDQSSGARRRAALTYVLRSELLPRVLTARRAVARPGLRAPSKPSDPERLAAALARGKIAEARAEIQARLQSGADPMAVMIMDLAPAARSLGQLWERDDCDFFDVTLGARALQQLMNEFGPETALWAGAAAPAILIGLAPGETHELGAEMVARVFRVAGWRADRHEAAKVGSRLARDWYDAVGFSLSCDRFVEGLGKSIAEARALSRNRKLKILVGGPLFAERPKLAETFGADFCSSDADVAVNLPHTLLEALRL